MDKKERAQIVAVKLTEVLREEGKKLADRNSEALELARSIDEVVEVVKMKDQYLAMKKAAETYKKQLEARVDELNKESQIPVKLTVSSPWDENKHTTAIDVSLKDPLSLNAASSANPTDIVTTVTQLRNHENERVQMTAREGYSLVIEDDMELLEKFLRL